MHEFGHTIQSKIWGPMYLPIPGLLSLRSSIVNIYNDHNKYWVEVWANTHMRDYLKKHFDTYVFPTSLIVKY